MACANNAINLWQGGNQWSGYDSYISFFRHVSKLPLEYSKWDHWETLSLHSSVRFVHEKFCIICDRPEILTVDAQNRPHNETGPFCRWRDGASLFAVNGVRMAAKWVLTDAEKINPKDILAETNVEVRRELIRKVGIERFIQTAGAKILDKQGDYELISVKLSEEITDARYLKMINPSILCYHCEGVDPSCKTVQEAINWRSGIENEDWLPAVLT